MKRYIKDGIIKTRQEIVIVKNGMRTINPTEEHIFADGWVEYIPTIVEQREVSEEQKAKAVLVRARHKLRNNIIAYDSSSEVNAFYMQGQQMWLDKATRAGLMLRFQAEQVMGYDYTTLWHNGQMYEISLAGAFQMLYALEVYASQCYDNTQRHLAAIQELQTIEEVESYDYTVGYPEKLSF